MQASTGIASMWRAPQDGQISSDSITGTLDHAVVVIGDGRFGRGTLGLSLTAALRKARRSLQACRAACCRCNLRAVVDYGVNMAERCTIGTLARRAGVNVETIRYYQRRGLVPEPVKPLGGIRNYAPQHVQRLRFIKRAQQLGFSLQEVGELLSLEDGRHCHEVEQIAGQKLAAVRERITQLTTMESTLARLVRKCSSNEGKVRCPLITALASVAD